MFFIHHIGNDDTREELRVFVLNDRLGNCWRRWKVDWERMSDSRQAKRVWKCKPIGNRSLGRSNKLEDTITFIKNLLYCCYNTYLT